MTNSENNNEDNSQVTKTEDNLNESLLENSVKTSDKIRKRLTVVIIALATVLVILLGVLTWKLYLGPQNEAKTALDNAAKSHGQVTAVNTSMETFTGQKINNANVEQKALAVNGETTNPPAFIFNNGKDNPNRKVMKFYFDFADQRSRDALIMNSLSIRGLVESGQVELQLHPLFGGKAYSMYASEALAEVFATQPEIGWDSLMALLRNAPAIAGTDDNDEMVNSIVSTVKNVGSSKVDAKSIKNGTFATWLLSIGNDPVLNSAIAPKLPHILVGDSTLNLSANELNNPDAFRRAIVQELKR